MTSIRTLFTAVALAAASFAPAAYAAETQAPASDVAPSPMASPGAAMPLPMEPTAAGTAANAKPEPHAQAVREAKTQYAQDKETCRENTMTRQEFRDCKKAAKMERNERFKDSPAQIPVAP